MGLLEGSWFLISFLIIAIVLLVDPKSSLTTSGQQVIYKFSALLIGVFFILTLTISLDS
jgi:hypothetical protein